MTLEPDQNCDGCGEVIHRGQHYLRGIVFIDTAGMKRPAFDVPEPVTTGIFCLPNCVAIGTLRQLIMSDVVQDVFNGPH